MGIENENHQKDHDLLVRLDEKVNGLIGKVDNFTSITYAFDNRIRKLEDDNNKLSPIPAYSHEQVVKDLEIQRKDIEELKSKDNRVMGGWKAVTIIGGSFLGFVSFLTLVVGIVMSFLHK